jgi:hypothetical protein
MEKLNQIITEKALIKFEKDTYTAKKRVSLMLKYATLEEFFMFLSNPKSSELYLYFKDHKLGELDKLSEIFCRDVLWSKLKDKYIEDIIERLENKL